jgi:putative oxidoreductase
MVQNVDVSGLVLQIKHLRRIGSNMKAEIRNTIVKAFPVLTGIGSSLQTPLLLAVRLYWGWQFAQTGWGKLHNISHVTQFFMSLGIPAPGFNAWAVAIMEFVGGILLIVGLGSRLTGLALSLDMIVAYVTADRQALAAIFSDPGKFYNADPYTFLFASLLVLVFGPGKLALDSLLGRRFGALTTKSGISAAAGSLREIPVAARAEAYPARRIS